MKAFFQAVWKWLVEVVWPWTGKVLVDWCKAVAAEPGLHIISWAVGVFTAIVMRMAL